MSDEELAMAYVDGELDTVTALRVERRMAEEPGLARAVEAHRALRGRLRDNPVLTRELLVTLRSSRAFVLQLLYVCALGSLVFFQWPAGEAGARQVSPGVARTLFDIFFLGQFFLVALMAPTFASGSITGEKERKTYELLLASPLRPATRCRASSPSVS